MRSHPSLAQRSSSERSIEPASLSRGVNPARFVRRQLNTEGYFAIGLALEPSNLLMFWRSIPSRTQPTRLDQLRESILFPNSAR